MSKETLEQTARNFAGFDHNRPIDQKERYFGQPEMLGKYDGFLAGAKWQSIQYPTKAECEMAIKNLANKGLEAKYENERVYVSVSMIDLELSAFEVGFQVDEYAEANRGDYEP